MVMWRWPVVVEGGGGGRAVEQASHLDDIGFPEFTAKLITDTFDAIVAANMRQTKAYIELVQQMAKTLTEYISDTHDDIGSEELLQFLAAVLPPPKDDQGEVDPDAPPIAEGASLTQEEVDELNPALVIPNGPANVVAVATPYDEIMEAVAKRLAANNYGLLQEMVKLGILRLVVENGTIQTQLTFTTWESEYYQKHRTTCRRKVSQRRAAARTGWLVSLWTKASASTRRTSLSVTTTRTTDRDTSGSRVQIYGSVVINFKTDYQPLA